MPNDSSTGGPLAPAGTVPYDADLDAIFQALVAGITGLAGQYVRPFWQPVVPKQPDQTTNWCALAVTVIPVNDGPSITHDPTGNGSDVYIRHEQIDVLAAFYGPAAQGNASILRDGLALPQNTESLNQYGTRWIECASMRSVPDLVNEKWIRRTDVNCTFRREVSRVYPVLTLVGSNIDLFDDTTINRTITVP